MLHFNMKRIKPQYKPLFKFEVIQKCMRHHYYPINLAIPNQSTTLANKHKILISMTARSQNNYYMLILNLIDLSKQS